MILEEAGVFAEGRRHSWGLPPTCDSGGGCIAVACPWLGRLSLPEGLPAPASTLWTSTSCRKWSPRIQAPDR